MEITDESDLETLSSGPTDSNKPNNSIPAPPEDNFYSPQNRPFYAKSPYKPLDPTQQQIRLLKFLPSNDDEVLSFALLDNRPLESVRSRYTALSYCAGDPRKTKAIYVNGARFNAFANLEYALREVVQYWRKNGMNAEEELLWVDQVCINQSNPDERSHQVGQMRDIYTAADRVLIALETEEMEPRSGIGIEWLLEIKRGFDILLPNKPNQEWMFDFLVTSFSHARFQDGFLDFYQMICSPWWQRGWIYQEFVVASEANFLYGGASVSWRDMHTVLYDLVDEKKTPFRALLIRVNQWWGRDSGRLYESIMMHDQPSNKQLSQLRQCRDDSKLFETVYLLMRRKHFWKGPTGLMGWLESSQTCQTSDPRDRVYAFLGLAHPQYNIIPDYSPSNTIEKLTLEVARKVLEAEGTLDFLTYVRERPYRDSGARPSWVPDLNKLHSNKGSIFDGEKAGTLENPKLTRVNASINDSGAILTVEGIRLDTMPCGRPVLIWRPDVHAVHDTGSLSTVNGLFVKPPATARSITFKKGTCVWWFPGSSFVAVLAPEVSVHTQPLPNNHHWRFLCTSSLMSLRYQRGGWANSVTKLVLDGDLDGLLAMEDMTKEVIEIH
ncbi:HET-domain-containing protein [Hyaloscypha variabilis F]|uniref:HET-domain-containing protein n=1 Tax=Hyaloscypha variabilis (strain UAMH 11265 / GT02V1 / F) TaxID=1149755 RepID=A0A2J6SBT1_HYAVF|nr:HET-domain-containing protein [Hyaloscypha variabilis F]